MGKGMAWMMALAIVAAAGTAMAGIVTPDSDSFSNSNSPPTGWVNIVSTWTGTGTTATPATNVYNYVTMQRSVSGQGSTYDYISTRKMVVSLDMLPNLGGEVSHMGFEILTPAAAQPLAGANGGVGYMIDYASGGNTLRLYRDAVQWDGAPVSVASVSLGTGYNNAWHTYRVEVEYLSGNSAKFTVLVDGTSKLTYTDTAFMPKAGWSGGGAYTAFGVGVYRATWPGYGTAQVDNYQLFFEEPPAPVAEPAAVGLIGLALLGLRRRRS